MKLNFPELIFKRSIWLNLIMSSLTVSSMICCSPDTEDDVSEDPRNLKNNTTAFIYNAIPQNPSSHIKLLYSTAVNAFSVNLLREIYKDSLLNKNLVTSPLSISRNLAILTEGVTGKSKEELLSALGGETALSDAKDAMAELLYTDNSVILQCADALWINSNKYSVNPTFKETANKKFGVECSGIDFSDVSKAVETINTWISNNTNNYLNNVISSLDINPSISLLLTNAIYFEADWSSPFDVTKTRSEPFYSPKGTVIVQMMSSEYYHDTRKTDIYENARIYYGTSGADYFYMDIYMPVKVSIEEFIRNYCISALSCKDTFSIGALKMPKFALKSDLDLIPALKQLGVEEIFEGNNLDLAGLVQNAEGKGANLFVYMVKHVAGIETDEEGTKAYAVTITGAVDGGSFDLSPDVILDKPFVYFIRAGINGLVLFAGVVNNPLEK